jgi:osmotically-inducible protein OsmY
MNETSKDLKEGVKDNLKNRSIVNVEEINVENENNLVKYEKKL